jgi:hypothetical protein
MSGRPSRIRSAPGRRSGRRARRSIPPPDLIEIAETGKAKLQRQYFDMATMREQLGITS